MKASNKSPKISHSIDDFSKAIFGRSRTKSIEANICVSCGGEAIEFKDELSKKEYTISGMCQKCQDDIFG